MAKKVALGMSGGVDSSFSAKLLLDQGYDVHGVFLAGLYPGPKQDQAIADAASVAQMLGISFEVIKLGEKTALLRDYFFQTYAAGRTPNVCVLCNAQIKFGFFYQLMLERGFDLVATGHYARLKNIDKQVFLQQAADKNKDQTYFLSFVAHEVWPHVIFPLGDYPKPTVRQLASQAGLPVAAKKESMDVCFLQNDSLREALASQIPDAPGPIVTMAADGSYKTIGRHRGLNFYTIGQRHGLEIIPDSTDTPVYFVKCKDRAHGALIVTTKEGLAHDTLDLINLTPRLRQQLADSTDYSRWQVRIRHRGELLPVKNITLAGDHLRVTLLIPASAPAPGQFAVFYAPDPDGSQDLLVMGAGEINL